MILVGTNLPDVTKISTVFVQNGLKSPTQALDSKRISVGSTMAPVTMLLGVMPMTEVMELVRFTFLVFLPNTSLKDVLPMFSGVTQHWLASDDRGIVFLMDGTAGAWMTVHDLATKNNDSLATNLVAVLAHTLPLFGFRL